MRFSEYSQTVSANDTVSCYSITVNRASLLLENNNQRHEINRQLGESFCDRFSHTRPPPPSKKKKKKNET